MTIRLIIIFTHIVYLSITPVVITYLFPSPNLSYLSPKSTRPSPACTSLYPSHHLLFSPILNFFRLKRYYKKSNLITEAMDYDDGICWCSYYNHENSVEKNVSLMVNYSEYDVSCQLYLLAETPRQHVN